MHEGRIRGHECLIDLIWFEGQVASIRFLLMTEGYPGVSIDDLRPFAAREYAEAIVD